MRRLEAIVAWTAFPLVMTGAIGWTLWNLAAGVDPAKALIAPSLTSFFAIAVLERVFPFHEDWGRPRGDVRVDFGHFLVSSVLTLQLLRPLMLALGVAAGGALSRTLGSGPWPSEWPLLAQLLLALVFGEFFMYWVHRLGHEWEWLWRFHAVHHSAPRLYAFNAIRFHPVDLAISNYAPFVPLVIAGAGEPVLALFALVSAVHGFFQHANLVLRLGPQNWFWSMAELHRWHHSRRLEEANSNYGQNLIVWDVVFGTRKLPEREPPEDIGIADMPAFPQDYLGQLLSPLHWKQIPRKPANAASEGRPAPT